MSMATRFSVPEKKTSRLAEAWLSSVSARSRGEVETP
jgi:hypothetical protein